MRVNVERLPGSTVAVDIFADEAEFNTAYEAAVRKINREVTLPGFRKGKVPRQMLERMVGRDAIVAEAGQDMMDGLFKRAIEQEQLVPVGEPKVELLQPEPLGFKVVVEVFPTPTLGDYAAVRVESREVEIEESEVQTVLDQLQKTHAVWNELETPRQPRENDQVVLDLTVYDGDEVFQESKDATFVIGESALFDSIEEALKMMLPGSAAELTLSFEEDDETVAPEVRGKVLRYDINLKAVNERELPPIDDELARKAGDFDSVDALHEQIRKDLLRNKAVEARGEVVTEVINAMAEASEVEIPTAMIEKEIDDELTQFRSRLAQQRLSLEEYLAANDQTLEALRDEIRPNAQRRVRNSIVLQEIAKAEEVAVTDDDIAGEIERLTGPAENPERLRALYQSDYFRGLLENEMFDRKLTDRLVEIATEGRGAVTGAGAEALKAELEPPAREATAVEAPAVGEHELEATAGEPSAEEAMMDASSEGEPIVSAPEQVTGDSEPGAEEALMDAAPNQPVMPTDDTEPATQENDTPASAS